MTSNDKSDLQVNEIRHAVLSAGDLYSKRPDLFKLFGDFDGTKDLLFKVIITALIRCLCSEIFLFIPLNVICHSPMYDLHPGSYNLNARGSDDFGGRKYFGPEH